MSEKHNESSINWGTVGKSLLAGGAVIAGIAIVCPGMLTGVAETLAKIGATDKGAQEIAKVGGFEKAMVALGSGVNAVRDSLVAAVGRGVGTIITKVAGLVIGYKGIQYLLSDKSDPSNAQEHAERFHEARESFALREDMRKMQAVMVARMQAAGQGVGAAGPAVGA